jgi:hypothetical protein
LTVESQVELFKNELQNSARFLRNAGIILIVGASSISLKYKGIYEKVLEVIKDGKYSNFMFKSFCFEYRLETNTFEYSFNDKYGERMRICLKKILDHMAVKNLTKFIHQGTLKELTDIIDSDSGGTSNWEIHIIRKKVTIRDKFKRKKRSEVLIK